MASNKGRAYFSLSGYHFNPEDITRLIGVEPTSTNDAGMRSGADKPAISSWELSTDTVTSEDGTEEVDLYKLTEITFKQLEPIKEQIIAVCKSHNLSARFGVVVTLSIAKGDSCPDVGFGGRLVKFLSDIGAFIDVDYKLSDRV